MQGIGSDDVYIRDDYAALKRTAELFSDAVSYPVQAALGEQSSFHRFFTTDFHLPSEVESNFSLHQKE